MKMLNDTRLTSNKDGSLTVSTHLFVNTLSLPEINVAGTTVKATLKSGGGTPGPDTDIFVEVTIPKKAVQPVPVAHPVVAPVAVAAPAVEVKK